MWRHLARLVRSQLRRTRRPRCWRRSRRRACRPSSLHARALHRVLTYVCMRIGCTVCLHTHVHATACTCYSMYMLQRAHAHAIEPYTRASYRRACGPSSGGPRCWNGSTRPPSRRDIYTYTDICIRINMHMHMHMHMHMCMYCLNTRPPSRRSAYSNGQPYGLFARAYDLFAHAHVHRRTRCSPRGSAATRRETSGPPTNAFLSALTY